MVKSSGYENWIDKLQSWPQENLEALSMQVKSVIKQKREEKLRAAVASHSELVGRCFKARVAAKDAMFPYMWQYYKVISPRATNEYWVTALTFYEYPLYWFNYQSSFQNAPGDYFFGHYDFEGIETKEVPYYCNSGKLELDDQFVDITEKEYNEAMNTFIQRLQTLQSWPADHCRVGNKKPGDEGWEKIDI